MSLPIIYENKMTPLITQTVDGHLLILAINRPDKKNAITQEMYRGLAEGLERAEQDSQIRVVVITGTEQCFSAGNDIAELRDKPADEQDDEDGGAFVRFITALITESKPVVAAVSGIAIGIGATMLLHCDLVYASDTARFRLPFTDLGLVPEAASSLLLPRLSGHARACELILLAEPFDAEVAKDIGLVNQIFPPQQLHQEALAIAHRLASKPPGSVQATKRMIKRHLPDIEQVIADELVIFSQQQRSPEAQEALSAILEKRPADFSQF